jgi:hypothetical protein
MLGYPALAGIVNFPRLWPRKHPPAYDPNTMIYQGPGVVRTITMGLVQLLARDGVKNVRDVVGVDAV